MLRVPHEGGSVYTIAPADDETRVRRVHRTMLKAIIGQDPPGNTSLHDLPLHEESPPEEEPSLEYDLLVLGQPSSGTVPAESPVGPTTSEVPPSVLTDQSSSLVRVSDPGNMGPRRTTRQTAGQHSNMHHLPRAVGDVHVVTPSISASNLVTAVFFRPWS